MLSNNKLSVGFTLLLAGCAGRGGYGDAPRSDAPPAQAIDQRYAQAPQDDPPPPARDAAQRSGYQLQGDYPPEPGAPSYDDAAIPPADAPPPARATPGARYDRPGVPYRATPAVAPERHAPPAPLPYDAPPAVAASTGPRGTSGEARRYDAVGYAGWYGEEMGDAPTASGQPFDPSAITAAHRTLPLGSIVEVTALDTGRTILALINDRGPVQRDREIDLSRGAAQLLGLNATAPVRVRLVTASAPDIRALRSGQAAAPRIDAPASLLTALRHKLPPRAAPAAVPARSNRGAPAAPPPRAPRGGAGLYVQVAALSNEGKAQALATSLQGRIERAGSIYRVQIGPYANAAAAQRARDEVARRGYGDARIVQAN